MPLMSGVGLLVGLIGSSNAFMDCYTVCLCRVMVDG